MDCILCHRTYKSKSTSFEAKLKHYWAIVKSVCLYAAETLAKVDLLVEKKVGKFLRRSHDQRKYQKDLPSSNWLKEP